MENLKHPIDVNPFFREAQNLLVQIRNSAPITSAILDDWNTGKGINGARIVYGGQFVEDCKSMCSECPLYRAVGEDDPLKHINLRTSLCLATEEQLNLFPSKQKYLNCKTPEEYQAAFALCILEMCTTPGLIMAELDWVKGFRLLLVDCNNDASFLAKKEKEYKGRIIQEVLEKMERRQDLERHKIVYEYGKEIGLILNYK